MQLRSIARASLALVAVLLGSAAANAQPRAVPQRARPTRQLRAARPPPLVTPDWLAKHAADPDVRVLDTRPSVRDYLAGHVPQAVYLPDSTLRGPRNGMPVQYLPDAQLAQVFRLAGVRDGDHVVVYSEGANVLGATMIAYALERLGHPDVSVLDGGFSAFQRAYPTAQQYPSYRLGRLTVRPNRSISATLADVKRLRGRPRVVIVDSRPAADYTGQVRTWQRNGHIPGAIDLDWRQLMQPGNLHQFKPPEQLRALVMGAGIDPNKEVIVYCGTGREATAEVFALRHLLNYPKVRLYDGSWTEWSAHPELPMATGSEPSTGIGGSGSLRQRR